MKKKNILILFGVGSLLLFTACASTPRSKGRDFSSHAPLGLVMVVSNQDINWLGEKSYKDDDAVSGLVRNMLGLNREEEKVRFSVADGLLNDADAILRMVLTNAGVFRLEDRERTVNSIQTAAARSKSAKMPSDQITAEGYRYLKYRDKQFAANFSRETGVNSLLYVTFEFNKEMVSGFSKTGKARSRVFMDAIVVSSSGKVLFHDQFENLSSERMDVTNGAYLENELMNLLREGIGEVCYSFVWNFKGISVPR